MTAPYASGKRWTIHHADALEWLATHPDNTFDIVATDSPYSINTKSDGYGKLNPWADHLNAAHWYTAWIRECRRTLTDRGALWTAMNWRSQVPFTKAACDLRWSIESMLVWNKDWIGPGGPSGLRPSYELLALWLRENGQVHDRGLSDVQTFPWSAFKPSGHPAEKPVDLLRFCIRAVAHEGIRHVADPFTGSGSTGVAAMLEGHTFAGCEIDEAWCEVAAKRLTDAEAEDRQVPAFKVKPKPIEQTGVWAGLRRV